MGVQREREKVDVYVFMPLLELAGVTKQVPPPLDATTPSTTDRLRVISLSPLTHILKYLSVRSPSQCTVWHQQSCATRTRPCGDFKDLEKMSQISTSLVAALLYRAVNVAFKKGTKITFYARLDW